MNDSWRPTATRQVLIHRAKLLASIRQFFLDREVLEVETPALAQFSVTDPYMEVISTDHPLTPGGDRYFLQTSPEYAMKRLLAAGSGPIYQICKAFRKGERGVRHNPEFTMLEWYRPGFDHQQLMTEVEELVSQVLHDSGAFKRSSYRELFLRYLSIDPHQQDAKSLRCIARDRLDVQMQSDKRDDWLNLLLAEIIEPQLGVDCPEFVYDYPASQSALAKVVRDEQGVAVAQRFELYSNGIELANGFNELTDAAEQHRRFSTEQRDSGKAIDGRLIAAMEQGLPECAGVALGLDRLLMVSLGVDGIKDVIAFAVERA